VLRELPDRYFEVFDCETCVRHFQAVASLTPETPAFVLHETLPDAVRVTVVSYDHPGEFSWIAGLIASLGGDVRRGYVFTCRIGAHVDPHPQHRRNQPRHRRLQTVSVDTGSAVIDTFDLVPLQGPAALWASELEQLMRDLFLRFAESGDLNVVRAAVNNRVAEHLVGRRDPPAAVLLPLDLELTPDDGTGKTIITVRGQDTPAFLYCLGNALAANAIYIDSIDIETVEQQVVDTFRVTDAARQPLLAKDAQHRLRLAVLLTKQFSHFLGSAADPFKALLHFNALLERYAKEGITDGMLADLQNPEVLRDLARVLGASDFLWEDFIRLQTETLLPLLKQSAALAEPASREQHEVRLQKLLAEDKTYDDKCRALNEYKDRCVFLTDLLHILEPDRDLQALADDLTQGLSGPRAIRDL